MAANKFVVATETLGSKECAKQHYLYILVLVLVLVQDHS